VYLIVLCSCTGQIAGTETTNGDKVTVTAGLNSIKGTAPVGTEILIFSDDYYPFNDSGFTDNISVSNSKTFQFLNLESGNYNLFCTRAASDTSVFIQQISVQATHYSDTVSFAITGAIKGALVDSLNKPLKGVYAYIKGSPFFASTNDLGEFELARIPDGVYSVLFKRTDTNSTWIKGPPVSVSVAVTAGKATEITPVVYK
jgi:hypothetical protein